MARLSSRILAKLTTLLDERTALADQIKALNTAKKAIDAELGVLATDAGGLIETDAYRVKMVEGSRTSLDRDKLAAALTGLGVKPTVVKKGMEAGTVTSTFSYPKVTKKAEGGGEG